TPLDGNAALLGDRAREEIPRDQHFASRSSAHRFDDLAGCRVLGELGGGAGIDRVHQRRFRIVSAVEHDRRVRMSRLDHARSFRPGDVR
ncbi:MAG: hypothetical protein QOI23_847, partial [Chloroflexota bacterium]|nr:hypothetical protein [Chloroflexota bacterium]